MSEIAAPTNESESSGDPTVEEAPIAAVPRAGRGRLWIVAAAIVGLAALAIGGAGFYLHGHATMTVRGEFTLSGSASAYSDCQGKEGYDDIGPNTQVTISSGGTVLGVTNLGKPSQALESPLSSGGVDASYWCGWTFTFSEVPRNHAVYTVEVAHRGGVNFTKAEAAAGKVGLSLG